VLCLDLIWLDLCENIGLNLVSFPMACLVGLGFIVCRMRYPHSRLLSGRNNAQMH
jgi:hypothetical protein